jgi:hypothetical protein
MSKLVGKLSFILSGIAAIVMGIFAPDEWPVAAEFIFGGVGVVLVYLGGWFKKMEPPIPE